MRKAVTNSTQLKDSDTPIKVVNDAGMNLWFVEAHEPSEN